MSKERTKEVGNACQGMRQCVCVCVCMMFVCEYKCGGGLFVCLNVCPLACASFCLRVCPGASSLSRHTIFTGRGWGIRVLSDQPLQVARQRHKRLAVSAVFTGIPKRNCCCFFDPERFVQNECVSLA